MKSHRTLLLVSCTTLLAAACEGPGSTTTRLALEAECAPPDVALAPADWRCGEDLTLECTSRHGAGVDTIYVVSEGEAPLCAPEDDLQVNDPGPFAVGEHEIAVTRIEDAGEGSTLETTLCESRLAVIDTTFPVVTVRDVVLWPPDHSMHVVAPADCLEVHDACDPMPRAAFYWVTSDEPEDELGDGATEVDAEDLGEEGVALRAERSGKGNGRVYTLGWQVEDASGNFAEGTCRVLVPHDQGNGNGKEHDDGGGFPAWTMTLSPPAPVGVSPLAP